MVSGCPRSTAIHCESEGSDNQQLHTLPSTTAAGLVAGNRRFARPASCVTVEEAEHRDVTGAGEEETDTATDPVDDRRQSRCARQ